MELLKFVVASICMFIIHVYPLAQHPLIMITIIVFISIWCTPSANLYGHLTFINLIQNINMLSCTFIYSAGALPYIFYWGKTTNIEAPLEYLVLSLMLQGLILYIMDQWIQHKRYILTIALLLSTYIHNGPYTWIFMDLHQNTIECALRSLLETLLPVITFAILRAVYIKKQIKL